MEQRKREAEPFFTQPVRQFTLMAISLGLFGFGAYVAFPRVAPVFLANPWLNGMIAFVFFLGVVACFWQMYQIWTSVGWVKGFVEGRPGHEMVKAPQLLAPLAALLRGRGARAQISSTSSRSILDSVATRIDESRDITRYLGSLLIFLGLLGTFWGLATTVPAVVDTIRSLAPKEGEGAAQVFSRLMGGLEAQLGGMGVAFSSSLLGLAGSLTVGLLEIFANHGQNRFYRELEEWLSSITRLGFSTGDGEGEGGDLGVVGALLEHSAEQLESLQSLVSQSDARRSEVDQRLGQLCTAVDGLVEKLGDEARQPEAAPQADPDEVLAALTRIAQGQERLIETVEGQPVPEDNAQMDAESRMRLRSIDVQLLRILEEMAAGRQEMVSDLRNDISTLNASVRALAHGEAQRKGG